MDITKIIIADNQNDWKNKSGTGSRTCSCGSWQAHWENFSKRRRSFALQKCSVLGCSKPAEHGAHIFRAEDGMTEWIAPLCAECNSHSNTEAFPLKIGTALVSANKKETCG
ncbi:MAG: hypothetical protein LBC85_03465 [Fibromonadaceae bacterium]|nr:hypothetical protein [Fibromonadaceae bacterium]